MDSFVSKKQRGRNVNLADRFACFVAAKLSILIARTEAAPEPLIAWRTIGAEDYQCLAHALQQSSTADNLIVGMRHHYQCSAQQGLQIWHRHGWMHVRVPKESGIYWRAAEQLYFPGTCIASGLDTLMRKEAAENREYMAARSSGRAGTSRSPLEPKLRIAVLIATAVAAVAWAVVHFGSFSDPVLLLGTRWLAIMALVAYAVVRRSLTTWIIV